MIRRFERAGRAGFTLIEVTLAIGITIGLMFVALYFYQQASQLRRDALVEVERVTAARLFLERMTRELRSARYDPFLLLGIKGSSNSIEFVCATLAMPTDWGAEEGLTPAAPPSDLKIVRYALIFDEQAANAIGIARAEEGLLEIPRSPETGPATPARRIVADSLRHLQVRYWDGVDWVADWNRFGLPSGVEVTVGRRAPVDDTDEVFRRVVYLPGSKQILDAPAPLEFDDLFEEWEFP